MLYKEVENYIAWEGFREILYKKNPSCAKLQSIWYLFSNSLNSVIVLQDP